MGILQALILGVIQGVTEFLQISSSAHLILVPRFAGWPDQGLAADIMANTGTLFAVLAYFRRELLAMVRAGTRRLARAAASPSDARLMWWLLVGTIPAAVAGLLLQDFVATRARDPVLIAWNAILFGVLLFAADRWGRRRRTLEQVSALDALAIGAAQALALVPGVSRSGATIGAGLALGLERAAAARFAFLLSVPGGFLVLAKDLLDVVRGEVVMPAPGPLIVLLLASAAVGYAVIAFLLSWLRRRDLLVFVVYRILLGVFLLLFFAR